MQRLLCYNGANIPKGDEIANKLSSDFSGIHGAPDRAAWSHGHGCGHGPELSNFFSRLRHWQYASGADYLLFCPEGAALGRG